MGKRKISAEAILAAPPERVWSVFANVAGWMRWMPHVEFVEATGLGRAAPGTQARFRNESDELLGLSFEEIEEPRRARYRVEGNRLGQVEFELTLHPEKEGTRARLEAYLEAGGLRGALRTWHVRRWVRGTVGALGQIAIG